MRKSYLLPAAVIVIAFFSCKGKDKNPVAGGSAVPVIPCIKCDKKIIELAFEKPDSLTGSEPEQFLCSFDSACNMDEAYKNSTRTYGQAAFEALLRHLGKDPGKMARLMETNKNINSKFILSLLDSFPLKDLPYSSLLLQLEKKDSLSVTEQKIKNVLFREVIKTLFTDSVKKALDISYPIFNVYKYTDNTGEFYTVLTESRDSIGKRKDTFNLGIKAYNFLFKDGRLAKTWDFSDKKITGAGEELSIWFWTRFAEFKDYDSDVVKEPIIVYGTNGINGFDDGRVKFVIFYRGNKIMLHHQNAITDAGRHLEVDKAFYSLPQKLQDAVKEKMEQIVKRYQSVFPAGWQQAMQEKKTSIKEAL